MYPKNDSGSTSLGLVSTSLPGLRVSGAVELIQFGTLKFSQLRRTKTFAECLICNKPKPETGRFQIITKSIRKIIIIQQKLFL